MTVFGDEGVIDLEARTWGAVQMGRCLDSLAAVTGRVVEVGCGAGRCIRTIRHNRPDLDACGCDLSAGSIAVARRHDDGVQYETADAATLPYPDGTFDAECALGETCQGGFCATTMPLTVIMDGDKSITASFADPP
jgi:SAM-dependent methyltransferase